MKLKIILMTALLSLTACEGQNNKNPSTPTTMIQKTDADWKKELTAEQYNILREKGTESPFVGEYVNTFSEGIYVCAACGNKLFESDAKFQSDCGWPSYDKAITGSVIYEADHSLGMKRTEVMCANCGGHLGHVFDDGPKETTGKRYCTNSVSVKFIPANQ